MQFIDHELIEEQIKGPSSNDQGRVNAVLKKSRELKGLEADEVLTLLKIEDPDQAEALFETAAWAKNEIYGNRLVLFAPLYISNMCQNECLYCAFRAANKQLVRRALSQEEIKRETTALIDQGHKRILLVAGESHGQRGLNYVLEAIDSIYSVKQPKGHIRRLNVNIAPLTLAEFKQLSAKPIGTYQLFQETYHRPTYEKLHIRGPKKDYLFRLETMDRALQAGLHDVGIGILFGLYDWRFEILALLQHIRHLEKNFGIGPHTISVPRLEPAHNSDVSITPPMAVSDFDFKKIMAALRLAVPYTGLILSTRENAQMRREAFRLGVSQISAGSRTNPGGYGENEADDQSQFSLGDHRAMPEVIADMMREGYIPSFCTGCYRKGRVGADFMDLAKPGLIKQHCLPNAMLTFAEYLLDFSDEKQRAEGFQLIEKMIKNDISQEHVQKVVHEWLARITGGERDLYF